MVEFLVCVGAYALGIFIGYKIRKAVEEGKQ